MVRKRIICKKCGWAFLSKHNYEKHLNYCKTLQEVNEKVMKEVFNKNS
jgi:uncharacterized C2H2 Zn-finger protein